MYFCKYQKWLSTFLFPLSRGWRRSWRRESFWGSMWKAGAVQVFSTSSLLTRTGMRMTGKLRQITRCFSAWMTNGHQQFSYPRTSYSLLQRRLGCLCRTGWESSWTKTAWNLWRGRPWTIPTSWSEPLSKCRRIHRPTMAAHVAAPSPSSYETRDLNTVFTKHTLYSATSNSTDPTPIRNTGQSGICCLLKLILSVIFYYVKCIKLIIYALYLNTYYLFPLKYHLDLFVNCYVCARAFMYEGAGIS